jgi:dCTP diphosphatase
MTDVETTIARLKELVLAFTRERDWEQFHHPKDLGVALASEVGELLDHFRYKTNEQIQSELDQPAILREVAHELAECFWVILRLAEVCGVDLSSSLVEKLDLAALKYPADQSRGRADKYTAYQATDPES